MAASVYFNVRGTTPVRDSALEVDLQQQQKSIAAPGNRIRFSIGPGFSARRATH